MKQVDHKVYVVKKDPATQIESFNVMGANTLVSHFVHNGIGDSAHMRIGRAGRDDKEVGCLSQPPEIEYDHLARLQIVYGLKSGP